MHLMSSADETKLVILQELLHDISPESVGHSPVTLSPTQDILAEMMDEKMLEGNSVVITTS